MCYNREPGFHHAVASACKSAEKEGERTHTAFGRAAGQFTVQASLPAHPMRAPAAAASRGRYCAAAVFMTAFTCFWNIALILGLGSAILAMFSGA